MAKQQDQLAGRQARPAARRGHRGHSRQRETAAERAGRTAPGRKSAGLGHAQQALSLQGIKIFDFSWFLASAGGTRFLTALGAECIKVEWKDSPDTRMAAMAPIGGRAAREAATGPLPGVTDPSMGGQFNNKNAGKRGLSLNVRHPEGLQIARRLIAMSDVVAEGFSPGVLDRWGLGYDELRRIKPDIIYAQQSGMGTAGRYGRLRAVGPVAAALSGVSEMSGLPEPGHAGGWGYSYLDWIGAYSFATAMLAALYHRDRTGRGSGSTPPSNRVGHLHQRRGDPQWSANDREWRRYGNRSPYKPLSPHGAYRCHGKDSVAITCSAILNGMPWPRSPATASGWMIYVSTPSSTVCSIRMR